MRLQGELFGMLKTVAEALGNDLCQQMVFVGGCSTAVLITDEITLQEVRATDDVDLIVGLTGMAQWMQLQEILNKKGFTVSGEDEVFCRMRLGNLKVDFMPDDPDILGFSNRWYKEGIYTAIKYVLPSEGAFGCDVDDAQLLKMCGPTITAPGRYSLAECTGAKKIRREGNPDIAHVSTSYVELQNLTIRMLMRRFTRLTNALSKKVENHAHAVAPHMMYYDFFRIHKTLRVPPGMAAGVTDRLWEIVDIAKLVEDAEAKPAKRGPYKKQGQISN